MPHFSESLSISLVVLHGVNSRMLWGHPVGHLGQDYRSIFLVTLRQPGPQASMGGRVSNLRLRPGPWVDNGILQ